MPFAAILPRLPRATWLELDSALTELETCLAAAPSAGRIDADAAYVERLAAAMGKVGRVLFDEQLKDVVQAVDWWDSGHPGYNRWAREFQYKVYPDLTAKELTHWMRKTTGEGKQPAGEPLFFRNMAAVVLVSCAALRNGTKPAGATSEAQTKAKGDGEAKSGPPAPADDPPAEAENALAFYPGGFSYRNVEESLSGKPLDLLKALYQARRKTLTQNDLLKMIWSESNAGPEVVRNAISDARKALRTAMNRARKKGPADPIPVVDKGEIRKGEGRTAWKLLDLP